MKKYLVYGGDDYYPCGGMNDFLGDYDDQEGAISKCNDYCIDGQWSHVYCTESRNIIHFGKKVNFSDPEGY